MVAPPPFLKTAPAWVVAEYGRHGRPFALPAGQQILSPGGNCAGMSFITSGRVRVYLIGQDGREFTLYRLADGEGCVLTASCVLGRTPFPASAVVEEDASGATIPAETFREWVGLREFWREYVFRLLGTRLAAVLARFEEAAFERLDIRLTRFFIHRLDAGDLLIETTHQEIANELGSAREVVSRALERWQERGWVKLRRGAVEVVQADQLKRMAVRPPTGAGASVT